MEKLIKDRNELLRVAAAYINILSARVRMLESVIADTELTEIYRSLKEDPEMTKHILEFLKNDKNKFSPSASQGQR